MAAASPLLGALGPIGVLIGIGLVVKAIADSNDEEREKRTALEQYWLRRREQARGAVLGAARRIQNVAGLQSLPPFVEAPGTRNAWVLGEVVYYDPDWIMELLEDHCNDRTCNTSVVVGLVAHELGHWVYGDTYDFATHSWRKEYRADAWAAKVLAALGIPASHFRCVIEVLDPNGGRSHPPGPYRAEHIRVVYLRALGYRVAA